MFERITRNDDILNGKPIVRGTRVCVEMILEWVATGGTVSTIVRQYPRLAAADVEQAIPFAAANLGNDVYLSAAVPA